MHFFSLFQLLFLYQTHRGKWSQQQQSDDVFPATWSIHDNIIHTEAITSLKKTSLASCIIQQEQCIKLFEAFFEGVRMVQRKLPWFAMKKTNFNSDFPFNHFAYTETFHKECSCVQQNKYSKHTTDQWQPCQSKFSSHQRRPRPGLGASACG